MGALSLVTYPIGVFLVLVGVIIAVDAPFMKEILDEVEFLKKNRRLVGTVTALVGLALLALGQLA
jgi:cytochrome c biogenesis protein CcdA